MASSFAAALFAICVLIVTIGVLWFHIVRPIFEDFGIIRDGEVDEGVSHSQEALNTPPHVMSLEMPRTAADDRGRTQTDEVSAADRWAERMRLDKTRAAAIEFFLYSGWTITDLRREGILRGENAAVSSEIEAARKRLGMEPTAPYRTPIGDRPTDAKFQGSLN